MPKRYIGIKKEAVFGTAETAPTYVLDAESIELDPTGDAAIVYEGASGLDNLAKATRYESGGSFSIPVDSESVGALMYFALGKDGYTKSGTAPAITHLFKPAQAPLMDSFTAFVGKDLFEHKFAGCVIGGITLELSDGFLTASVDVIGGKDANGSMPAGGRPLTNVSAKRYVGHDVNFTIGGTAGSARVESFSITIETGAENGFAIGSRFPARAFRGSLNVEAEVTLGFYDLAELERFWGGTTGPTNDLTFFNATIEVGTELDITLPRAFYSSLTQPVGGRGRIEQSGTIKAIQDNMGAGPIEVSLTNPVTDYNA